jgi:hypothetical protein
LKIHTEYGIVEPINYDKYLLEYGGMRSSNNIKFTIPNLASENVFLLGKFSLKFNNIYYNSVSNSNCELSGMLNFIEILKRDFIKIKFILNTQQHDFDMIQFINLYVYKNSFINKNSRIKNNILEENPELERNEEKILNENFLKQNKIYPINEIITFNLNKFHLNDEIIVKDFLIY